MSRDPKLASALASVAALMNIVSSLPRRHLVEIMLVGETGVNDLATQIGLSQSATSQHLTKMRSAGIVVYRKGRQSRYYKISDGQDVLLLRIIAIADAHEANNKNGGPP